MIIQTVFDLCVRILLDLAAFVGMSYEAVNVWIFCVIWPLFTLLLMLAVIQQQRIIARLRKEARAK